MLIKNDRLSLSPSRGYEESKNIKGLCTIYAVSDLKKNRPQQNCKKHIDETKLSN